MLVLFFDSDPDLRRTHVQSNIFWLIAGFLELLDRCLSSRQCRKIERSQLVHVEAVLGT